MTGAEKVWGFGYLAFQLLALSTLLSWVCRLCGFHPSAAMSNFLYHMINVIGMICIFHRFLRSSLRAAREDFWNLLQAVVLGYVAYLASSRLFDWAMDLLKLSVTNVNDSAVLSMLKSDRIPTVLCVLLFAPLTEELLYRGLIFRNLYQRSRWLAYVLSMAVFSAVHVVGYAGSTDPVTLIVCFAQYLPAGVCLAWTYTKADNIYAPILVHMIANAVALGLVR